VAVGRHSVDDESVHADYRSTVLANQRGRSGDSRREHGLQFLGLRFETSGAAAPHVQIPSVTAGQEVLENLVFCERSGEQHGSCGSESRAHVQAGAWSRPVTTAPRWQLVANRLETYGLS
jgi:hypothetical protein